MPQWNPKKVERLEHEVKDTDWQFALERVTKILYDLFRRFERSYPNAPALVKAKHEESR